MKRSHKDLIYKIWRILNGALATFFLYLIVNAWVQIFYFKNPAKQYYYEASLFIIPLITCLIVVFGWSLDDESEK
jgi:hypothetical protein